MGSIIYILYVMGGFICNITTLCEPFVYIMWNLYNGMNCTWIICIALLWLIPHPIVMWLTCGSMECNKDMCM
jgi:hypothetical protein